jgi:integrase
MSKQNAKEQLSSPMTELSNLMADTISGKVTPSSANARAKQMADSLRGIWPVKTARAVSGRKSNRKKEAKKLRGVFEKVPGSDLWWIQYFDADGRRRREKAGRKSDAIDLLAKRKAEKLQGIKLPEKLRARRAPFSELIADCEVYVKTNNQGQKFDCYRLGRLKEQFGNRPSEIPIDDLRKWINEQDWKPATCNRYKSLLSLIYKLGIENGKVKTNPAKLLTHRREDNGRIRFLNQYTPAKIDLDYLKDHKDEESRLRAVIVKNYAVHMPEFEIALHTGMRPSEQYGLAWDRVDLVRKIITIPRSKNGKTRHIRLNSVAVAAFKVVQQRSLECVGRVFLNNHKEPLESYKHWFEPAVSEAGIRDFTWYCLRHTFASRLAMAGVDLRTIADLMGHQTIQMTMRYAHLAPAHQASAVEKLVSAQPEAAPGDTLLSSNSFNSFCNPAQQETEQVKQPLAATATTSATRGKAAVRADSRIIQ